MKEGRLPCWCKGCSRTKYALGVSNLAWIQFQIKNGADFQRRIINLNDVFFCFDLRIHAKPGLADSIHEETNAFFSHTSNAKQSLHLENVPCEDNMGCRCPLLKGCYLVITRLDGKMRSSRKIQGDHLIPMTGDSDATPSHRLRFGDHIHALHYLQ